MQDGNTIPCPVCEFPIEGSTSRTRPWLGASSSAACARKDGSELKTDAASDPPPRSAVEKASHFSPYGINVATGPKTSSSFDKCESLAEGTCNNVGPTNAPL